MRPSLAGLALAAALTAAPAAAPAAAGAQEPAPALAPAPAPARGEEGGTLKLIVYDGKGRLLDRDHFLAFIGRADRKTPPDPDDAGILVASPEGYGAAKPHLEQVGSLLALRWSGPSRVALSLPWPVPDDGFSTVWADKGGSGFSDGDVVYLNEEVALTQYRAFKDEWIKHEKDMTPPSQSPLSSLPTSQLLIWPR